jgi:hypothetical protein
MEEGTTSRTVQRILGALYAWLAAIFLGAVILDVTYASLLGNTGDPAVQSAFREVSDFLILLGGPTLLAGLAALAACWKLPSARAFCLASLIALSFEFIAPVFFPALKTSTAADLPGFTSLIRLLPLLLASLFALAALSFLLREPVSSPSHPG